MAATTEIRLMTADDGAAAVDVTWRAMATAMPPHAMPDEPTRTRRGRQRNAHLLATDPGGSWVAVRDGTIVGVGMAIVREGLWALSQLAVDPVHQSRQVGRKLLDATLAYQADAVRGRLIASSTDPRALRRYRRAGLDLLPCVCADGALLARAIPDGLGSRPMDLRDDQELCDRASRHARGAAHGTDVGALLASHGDTALVHDDGGWAVAREGAPIALAAVDETVARDLLWSAFASGPRGATVHVANMTHAQQWAVDVCLDAGLSLSPDGPLFAAGDVGPLAPYLPSGMYL